MKRLTPVLAFLIFSMSISIAQDASEDFKTESISLFKNGSAFFLKSGTVKTTDGNYRITKNIPSALFGTFWIQAPNEQLKSVSSFNDQVVETNKFRTTTFVQMLSANLGKKVKLHIGKDEIVEGVVVEVEELKPDKKEDTLLPEQFLVNNLIILKTGTQWLSFMSTEIRRVEFLEKPNQVLVTQRKQNKPVLQMDFNSNKSKQEVQMMYLQNGLSWTPGYLIELIDDESAQLTLRAEVVNNAEEIKNTDVNFVVGVPNFRFATRLSSLVDFYNTYVPAVNAGFSNAMRAQTLDYGIEADVPVAGFGITAQQVTGTAEEDLFFYNLKNFSLKKGGRGHYPVFSKKIDIAHIYESSVTANNANQAYYQKSFSFTPDMSNKVFHSIKVMNETEFPWTTGVAMVVKGTENQKPISQDQLNYTPIKGHSFVKLTEAPDVKVKHAEREIGRQDKAMKNPQNKKYYLDLVTVEGQLKIKNYKAKGIDLNVRRTITGKLAETSFKWLKSERIQRSGQNQITDVCWETSIKSGEELIITYTYQVYVPD